ncbi:MAG: DNA/RNA nuclease SfsA [Schwartzia succinivorans]|nr:DNA/RNA nuclease SfsA [Schwartzia succinivorans]
MIYTDTAEARFIDRPNRFIAHVELGGQTETVHVKNTGRCRELLLPNIPVVLEKSDNPNRKTKYDLIAVRKKDLGWINIDSQAPNKVVKEWLTKQDFDVVIPEYSYGDSRIDFYMEKGNRKYLLEVKGCTLEIDGTGYFPDAPTVRGVKHIRELMKAQKQGFWCGIAFVIQMNGIEEVLPNTETHPEFGEVLSQAKQAGVHVLNLTCSVDKKSLEIISPVRIP